MTVNGDYPKITEKEKYLYSLAKEYHGHTEKYDRTVCTGPIKHGCIVPITSIESRLINKHALALRKELQEKAYEYYKINSIDVTKAIQKFSK